MTAPLRFRPQLDLNSIVKQADFGEQLTPRITIVSNDQEFRRLERSSALGMLNSTINDILNFPALAAAIIKNHTLGAVQRTLRLGHENPKPHEAAIFGITGYFGPRAYIDPFLERLRQLTHWGIIVPEIFNKFKPRTRVKNDGGACSEILQFREAATIVGGHSRGGLTAVQAMVDLQEHPSGDLSDNVDAVVLIAPVCQGVRPEIAPIARLIPSKTIKEMLPESEIVRLWQKLTPKNRAKFIIINSKSGDLFTSKERSYFPGATLIVVDTHDGHLQEMMNPETAIFMIAEQITCIIAAELDSFRQAA